MNIWNVGTAIIGVLVWTLFMIALWHIIRKEAPVHVAFIWMIDLLLLLVWAAGLGIGGYALLK